MQTFTANDAKRNFETLLLSAQSQPVIISENNKHAFVVMSIRDFEELEAMKVEYLKHCFHSAKEELNKGTVVDGNNFLNSL